MTQEETTGCHTLNLPLLAPPLPPPPARQVERRRQELKKEKKEKQEDAAVIELSNKNDKKCQRFEKDLKENARDIQKMQMLTTLLVGVSSAAVFYLLNRRYAFGPPLPPSPPPSFRFPLYHREGIPR